MPIYSSNNGNIILPEEEFYILEEQYSLEQDQSIFDEVKFIDDLKRKNEIVKDLKSQWKSVADKFVNHKWIYRYIYDDKQKQQLEKHYDTLTNENVYYSNYKRSYNFICKFMGLHSSDVIIENMTFSRDKQDKEMWDIALRYSKGFAKVKIPEGVRLIHVSPVEDIKELVPSFRSKVKGKYMYPTKRVFFTIAKDIKPNHAGLERMKTFRYTPKDDIKYAYIDPTYSDYKSGSVYIEIETPIPVEPLENKFKLANFLNLTKKGDK